MNRETGKLTPQDISFLGREQGCTPNHYIFADLVDFVPGTQTNHDVEEVLKSAGVLTGKNMTDSEAGGFNVYARSRKPIEAFVDRWNAFMDKLAAGELIVRCVRGKFMVGKFVPLNGFVKE